MTPTQTQNKPSSAWDILAAIGGGLVLFGLFWASLVMFYGITGQYLNFGGG